MGIDYGLRRTGLSVTDPAGIIVTGLETVETRQLPEFLSRYLNLEAVDAFIVGYPFLEGSWGNRDFKTGLDQFIEDLKKKFPQIPVHLHDERYSSSRAKEIMLQSGKKKKQRQDKALLDKTSAIIILQEYLGHI